MYAKARADDDRTVRTEAFDAIGDRHLGAHGRGVAGDRAAVVEAVGGVVQHQRPEVATVRLVPVEFLTDEQAEAYGKFAEEPTRPELEWFFFLDDVDRALIALRRSTHHQLGLALQMCTVRYIGRFLPDDPLDHRDRWSSGSPHSSASRTVGGEAVYRAAEDGVRARLGDPGRLRVPRVRGPGVVPAIPYLPARSGVDARRGPKALFDHAVGWLRRNRCC